MYTLYMVSMINTVKRVEQSAEKRRKRRRLNFERVKSIYIINMLDESEKLC